MCRDSPLLLKFLAKYKTQQILKICIFLPPCGFCSGDEMTMICVLLRPRIGGRGGGGFNDRCEAFSSSPISLLMCCFPHFQFRPSAQKKHNRADSLLQFSYAYWRISACSPACSASLLFSGAEHSKMGCDFFAFGENARNQSVGTGLPS